MQTRKLTIVSLFVLVALLAACAAPAEPVLTASGSVADGTAWTEAQIKGMPTVESEYTGKDGQATTYTGVPLSALLEDAKAAGDATAIMLVAADGYTAEVSMEELNACTGCIVAFQDGGGLHTVMPGFTGKQQVKDLIEIQVK